MLKYLVSSLIALALGALLYLAVQPTSDIHKKSHSNNISQAISRYQSIVKFISLCWFLPGPRCHILTTTNHLPEPDLHVKITGKQWGWKFEYKNKDMKPITLPKSADANNTQMLVLPLGKNIHLTFSSQDVIHTWTVPKFAISTDVIPGRIHTINLQPEKLGDFKGKCTELCGKNHDKMSFIVRVVPYATFKKWQ